MPSHPHTASHKTKCFDKVLFKAGDVPSSKLHLTVYQGYISFKLSIPSPLLKTCITHCRLCACHSCGGTSVNPSSTACLQCVHIVHKDSVHVGIERGAGGERVTAAAAARPRRPRRAMQSKAHHRRLQVFLCVSSSTPSCILPILPSL